MEKLSLFNIKSILFNCYYYLLFQIKNNHWKKIGKKIKDSHGNKLSFHHYFSTIEYTKMVNKIYNCFKKYLFVFLFVKIVTYNTGKLNFKIKYQNKCI